MASIDALARATGLGAEEGSGGAFCGDEPKREVSSASDAGGGVAGRDEAALDRPDPLSFMKSYSVSFAPMERIRENCIPARQAREKTLRSLL